MHINSGIPNHVFYLAATGFGGSAWEQAGPIWFATLGDPELTSPSTFAEFAARTSVNAETLFGADGRDIVTEAWDGVGITAE